MGQSLAKPETGKHSAQGTGNGLRYGLSSMQGWRETMEDAHTAAVGLPGGRADWSFFAVYDGHAGSRVADYCAGHMLEHILSTGRHESVEDGIRSGFLKIDSHMRGLPEMQPQQGLEPQQGRDLQQEGPGPQQQEPDRSGCTAVGVLLSPGHLYFINCGDSRAVLYRDGRVCFSTVDHKPDDAGERERIQNADGYVKDGRVNGGLAVSRALGDYGYKCVEGKGPTEQPVSPEPEVHECASGEGDEFVVLACDGIWDVMSNEELGLFVRSRLELWTDLETVCNAVVDTCLHKGSKDNMSVVLVCFPGAPKVSEEAKSKEKELDEFLETRVGELLKSGGVDGVPDLVTVVKSLATENINNLPPGGGLDSKRSVIEAAYNKLNKDKEEAKDRVDLRVAELSAAPSQGENELEPAHTGRENVETPPTLAEPTVAEPSPVRSLPTSTATRTRAGRLSRPPERLGY